MAQPSRVCEWPSRLPGLEWYPARWWDESPELTRPPDLLVLHSGDRFPGVAEYEATHGGYELPDGTQMRTSYHLAWSSVRGCLVQQVSLRAQAWHAGGSRWQGMGGVNSRSIGLALPGPAAGPRAPEQIAQLRGVVAQLVAALPSLRWWTRHSDIDASRRDPGPGLGEWWADGLGIERG